MAWGWEIFYGLATLIAVALSWKRGGAIAIAASMIGAMWLFQGLILWSGNTLGGNMMDSVICGTLMLLISTMPEARRETWGRIVMGCLFANLYLTVQFRLNGPLSTSDYIALNVLYIIQLIALGWSGGRIVLDSLGAWMARIRWGRRDTVAGIWAKTSAGRSQCGRRHQPIVRIGRSSGV